MTLQHRPTDDRRDLRPANPFPIGLRDMGTLIGLVVIVVVFSNMSSVFLTERNLINILQQSSLNACVAIGMTLVIHFRRHRSLGRPDGGADRRHRGDGARCRVSHPGRRGAGAVDRRGLRPAQWLPHRARGPATLHRDAGHAQPAARHLTHLYGRHACAWGAQRLPHDHLVADRDPAGARGDRRRSSA